MNIDDIKKKSEQEARLAALFLLKSVLDSGDKGINLEQLAIEISNVRNTLKPKRISLRLGYRNRLDEFVRCLFERRLVSLNVDPEQNLICRITEEGKSELTQNPPEELLTKIAS